MILSLSFSLFVTVACWKVNIIPFTPYIYLLVKLNKREDQEIKIKIIGLRKGEKLKEELSYEELVPTTNKMIFTAKEMINFNKFYLLKKFQKEFNNLDYNTKIKKLYEICSNN